MELLLGFRCPLPTPFLCRPSLGYSSKVKRNGGLRAKLSFENDPLLQVAVDAASRRYQETHRPVVGAKIPRGCSFIHIPMESSNVKQILCKKGFSGSHPSIWAIQGLPLMTLSSFEEVFSVISGLATTGSLFLGELPAWLAKTEVGIKSTTTKWVEKEFTSNGFLVDVINYNDIASSLGKEIESKDYKNILFVAEQLRFSEDQSDVQASHFAFITFSSLNVGGHAIFEQPMEGSIFSIPNILFAYQENFSACFNNDCGSRAQVILDLLCLQFFLTVMISILANYTSNGLMYFPLRIDGNLEKRVAKGQENGG